MEIHQKISMPNYQNLKTVVKMSIDHKLRLRNFDARYVRTETGTAIMNRKEMSGVEGGKGICHQWIEKASVRKKTNAVSGMKVTIVPQAFRVILVTRSKCVEEKKYPRQK